MNERFHIKVFAPPESEDKFADIWSDLLAVSEHSFFLSLGWMRTWIQSLPGTITPLLVVGYYGARPEIAFFIARQRKVRWGLFHQECAYLNSSGDAELDSLMIEYNKPLVRPGNHIPNSLFVNEIFVDIDEFTFPGCTHSLDIDRYFGRDFLIEETGRQPSHYVDLDAIRENGGTFLMTVSANRRRQHKKAIRDLQALGEVSITEAQSREQACTMLDDLAALHQAEWQSRGEPGAFASEYFRRFHKRLIVDRFAAGEIQMLAVTVGDKALGYLYNFVYNGEVLFYQCGFNYEEFSRFRPGFTCHVLAIEHNLKLANCRYNFLAGDAQYKKSLSTDSDELIWYRVNRKSTAAHIERLLALIKRQLSGRTP